MMGGYLPELILAALFILSDMLLRGAASAAAAAAAGVLAYTVSLMTGRGRIALLLEGLALGGLTLAARLSSFPGGALTLTEVVLGGFLLVSGIRGRPALERMAGGLARGILSKGESAVFSAYMGGGLAAHGVVTAAIASPREEAGILPVVLLPVFLAAAAFSARKRIGSTSRGTLPRLQEAPGGWQALLSPEGEVLGRVSVTGEGGAAVVEVRELDPACLPALEAALTAGGYRSVLIRAWPGDALALEMNGYSLSPGGWLRRLRG
jgi:hypothetical protein